MQYTLKMNDICTVSFSKQALKDLKKFPTYIAIKLQAWVDAVVHSGIEEVRKTPSYHDEPLKGDRSGQRSIRLNKAYRAIYVVEKDNSIRFIEVLEVTKHEY